MGRNGTEPIRWAAWATGADVVAGNRACRVMLAVLAGNALHGDLIEATGLPRTVVHAGLDDLHELGLVDWTEGSHGTLHPLVALV
jgi:DNA-binding IclR family transcriptional regulator